jgi:hypothetical protein
MATKYTKELLEKAAAESLSGSGVLRYLGLRQAGGTQAHILKLIKKYEIDTSHWHRQAHNKGKISLNRKTAEQILVVLPAGSSRAKRHQLLRAMTESGVDYVCSCGIGPEWNGKPLTLEINHKNGDWLDNRLENLEFSCPNCHSQEATSNLPHKYRN